MTYQISKTTDQLREEYVAPECAVLAFQVVGSITGSSNPGDPVEEEEGA